MSMICPRCKKQLDVESAAFCPFCGATLSAPPERTADPGVEKWLRKAAEVTAMPEKRKILLQAQAEYPDCFPIEWELLFIGHEKKRKWKMEFSIIKSFLLEIYRTPEDFSEERRAQDRREIFEDPQLLHCLDLAEDRDAAMAKYLNRLCREYIDIFLEGDSRTYRTFLGFRLERKPEKALSEAAAYVLRGILKDQQLSLEERDMLYKAFYQALSEKLNGNTEWLEQAMAAE